MQKRNVKYIAVGELQHLVNGKQVQLNLSESKIISGVGGVDKTGNSCASAALAFIDNKMGLDVLDFRGGDSLRYFANEENPKKIVNAVGGEVKILTFERKDDEELAWEMLHAIKKGHLYNFGCAQHAAIVRITNGKYQYLELQRGEQNGWKELTKESLVDRFFIVGRSELSCFIVDVENFQNNKAFRGNAGIFKYSRDISTKKIEEIIFLLYSTLPNMEIEPRISLIAPLLICVDNLTKS